MVSLLGIKFRTICVYLRHFSTTALQYQRRIKERSNKKNDIRDVGSTADFCWFSLILDTPGTRTGPSTFAHRTSAHHDFVTSAHQNWDICSPPSGHLLTKIWDICSPKSGHLLTKFLKFCNPIIKSESVPPGHVKDYILMGWCTRRLRRMSTRWWMRTMWSTRSWMKVHSWKIWWWWMYLYVSYWKQHTN